MTYWLYDADGNKYTLTGPYSITDGGYHYWRCMHFPRKLAVPGSVAFRQSSRLESVRKDVECTFGRSLKGRCQLLARKVPFPLQVLDDLVHVACMIHNMMLRHDKLDRLGMSDSDWYTVTAEPEPQVRGEVAAEEANVEPFDRDPGWRVLNDQVHAPKFSLPSPGMPPTACPYPSQLVTHYGVAFAKKEVKWRKTAQELGLGVAGERAAFTAGRGYRDANGMVRHQGEPEGFGGLEGLEDEDLMGEEGDEPVQQAWESDLEGGESDEEAGD